jgi:8-amino-7-oxononanoate synthase
MLEDFFKEKIADLKSKNLYRSEKIYRSQGWDLIDFSSNDYLGLAKQAPTNIDPQEYHGSSGSRLLTGTHAIHQELEQEIASWKKTEAAIFFGSGYLANIGTIPALADPHDVIFCDELNHACIIDGIRLSGAKKFFYKHKNAEHLEELIKTHRSHYKKAYIVSDSVFSMDGDKAEIEILSALGKKYNLNLYLDEAHATGIFGHTGAGLVEEYVDRKLITPSEIAIQMGTFSKAIGVEGGYIAGSSLLIDFLKNSARSFIFSTAPSPFIAKRILENIKSIRSNPSQRLALHKNITYLKNELLKKNIPFQNQDTSIFILPCKTNQAALEKSTLLINAGILVLAVRYPTVSTPRLRVCLSATHTPKNIDFLVKNLAMIERNGF